jgi:hypothetical protein
MVFQDVKARHVRMRLMHWPTFVVTPVLIALTCSTTRAELPGFPKDSIAPLYGKWMDSQKRNPKTYSIGPKWIAEFDAQCGYRYQYQIKKIAPKTIGPEKWWDIELETGDQVVLANKLSADGCSRVFPKKLYVYIGIQDAGDPPAAPIIGILWEQCDTEEHLQQYVAGQNQDQHGCAGSLAGRP